MCVAVCVRLNALCRSGERSPGFGVTGAGLGSDIIHLGRSGSSSPEAAVFNVSTYSSLGCLYLIMVLGVTKRALGIEKVSRMCGLVGIVTSSLDSEDARRRLGGMLSKIEYRGPDDYGFHADALAGVYFGHRRLAIIDPDNGKQPMTTPEEDLTVIFNGAIYNYLEIRRELISKGHVIHSYSDTEVLLYAYKEWGEACVDRFLGMFAFAIWDKRNNRIFCARDRIGIKPFYYYHDRHNFIFASEIKSILASGLVDVASNGSGLRDYLTFQFCLDQKTLFKNVFKLEPGHSLTVEMSQGISLRKRCYWDVKFETDEQHDESWFVDNLSGLIEDAVRIHLRSDVPLGAHLSGGLDSSAVACIASTLLRGERVKTFTGAFREGPAFDETEYAKIVSQFAGTEYEEIYIDGSDFSGILPKLIYIMDEPVAGPGLIPQYYVSKLASEHVKVVLGGQGGDELFIGYTRYLIAYLEKCLSGAIYQTADNAAYAASLASMIPNLPILQSYRPMLQSFLGNGLFDESDKRYFSLVDRMAGTSHLLSHDVLSGDYSPFEEFQGIFNRDGLHSLVNRMTYFDLKASLPALLQVEDRTSMAASIESRVPLLDHRLVEFMATIPANIKFSGGRPKYLFKEAIKNNIPSRILNRKDKMGFPTPIARWANGVGRDFVCDILLSDRAKTRGIYNASAVEQAVSSEGEFGRVVWGLLSLELWHRIFVDGDVDEFSI